MRRYGQWSGNEKGQTEDPARCVASVPSTIARGMVGKQCDRPRGKGTGDFEGLLCGVHARSQREGRRLVVPLDRSASNHNTPNGE